MMRRGQSVTHDAIPIRADKGIEQTISVQMTELDSIKHKPDAAESMVS